MRLEFYGAAGMVTGSCHILQVGKHKILLDCGMIQGSRKDEDRNREPFPFDPKTIDAVVLSHAHIDHSGRLPLLVKRGFTGPIYAHNATKDLCGILLEDSAGLSERDAEYQNRRLERKSRNKDFVPVEPLYTRADARTALKNLRGSRYREPQEILPGIRIGFRDAGHIMGSASVELELTENALKRRLVFSGDLGQYDTPILNDPAVIESADLIMMESTYGNRQHRDRRHTIDEIGEIIRTAEAAHGNILIPAFAIGRSQELLYTLGLNYQDWNLERWHVFLDSPMAIEASKVYWEYPHLYDDEATKLRRHINEMPPLANLHLTKSAEESMVINRMNSGALIIAGSGMCNGGRIVHHLKHNVSRPECHVIIVGYQAQGTLGRRLVDRSSKTVRIHGEDYPIKAQIHTLGGLSAHGDQQDLIRWVRNFSNRPPVYLVHGEPDSAASFKTALADELGVKATVATPGMCIDLARL